VYQIISIANFQQIAIEVIKVVRFVQVMVKIIVAVNMQFSLTNSQRYLVNAKPGANHSTNPTNPNGLTVSGNPNPTNPTYPTNPINPTNPTTKYRCEFVNLNCIYTNSSTNVLRQGTV